MIDPELQIDRLSVAGEPKYAVNAEQQRHLPLQCVEAGGGGTSGSWGEAA